MAQEPFLRLWPTVLLLSLSLPNFHLILIPDIHSYLKYSSGKNILAGRQTWTAQACYTEALTAFFFFRCFDKNISKSLTTEKTENI